MSPRVRISAACTLAAIALWAVVAVLIQEERRHVLQRVESAGRDLAGSLAEQQDAALRRVDQSLRVLREEWSRDARGFDAAVAQREDELGKGRLVEVVVLDADDVTRYSWPPLDEPRNYYSRESIQALKQRGADDLHISAPVDALGSGERVIQFIRLIFDAEKRYAGALIVALPPPALEPALRGIGIGPQGIIMLARADGTVLARTGLDPVRVVTLVGWPGLDADAPPSGAFSGRSRFDNVERLFAYQKLRGYPLTVYVGQDADAMLRPYHRDRDLLLLAGALGTLLLAALAARLVRRRARLAVREV